MSALSLDMSRFLDRESDDYPVFLLDVSHPSESGVQRICSSAVQRLSPWPDGQARYGLISRLGAEDGPAYEYTFIGLSLTPPGQEEDASPRAGFTIFRTDELVALLRSKTRFFDVRMRMAFARSPDIIEADYPDFKLMDPEISGATITGTIGMSMREGESFPGMLFIRRWFGGVR